MRYAFAFLFAFLVPFTTKAQTAMWVENVNTVDRAGDIAPQINVSVSHKFTPQLGLYVWALEKEDYGEIHFGPTFQAKGVIVSAGLGIETADAFLRKAADVFIYRDGRSLYLVGETGGSGNWYQVVAMQGFGYKGGDYSIGVHGQRYVGFGPRLSTTTFHNHVKIWIVPRAWDPENSKNRSALIAVRFTP